VLAVHHRCVLMTARGRRKSRKNESTADASMSRAQRGEPRLLEAALPRGGHFSNGFIE
jgi:hypothetical protein